MTHATTTSYLLRTIGFMAIAVAAAWLLQVLGFGGSSIGGRLMWVVGAATIAGAGVGLIYTSAALQTNNAASTVGVRRA